MQSLDELRAISLREGETLVQYVARAEQLLAYACRDDRSRISD